MEERENKKLGTILNYAIIVCIAAILIMIICGIVGKFLDKKTNRIGEFSERHPRLNMVIALALVVIMGTAGYVSIYYIVCKVKEIIHWIADMTFKMSKVGKNETDVKRTCATCEFNFGNVCVGYGIQKDT